MGEMKTLLHITMAVLAPVSLASAAMERIASVEGSSPAVTEQSMSGNSTGTDQSTQISAARSAQPDPTVMAVIEAGEHRYTVTDKAQIAFHTISRSVHTAYKGAPWARPGCHVMRSEKDWTAPGYVDYEHEMLIAVSLGSQDRVSGTVEIIDVKIDQDRVQVVYATHVASNPTQAPSHPHHLIRLPRADLPVEFRGPDLVPPFVAQ